MACVCLKEWLDIFNTASLARKTKKKKKEIPSVHLFSYIMATEAQQKGSDVLFLYNFLSSSWGDVL